MGRTVLASPSSPSPELRLYAHCLVGNRGGVGLLALNLGTETQSLAIKGKAQSWLMTATPLDSKDVSINGTAPALSAKGELTGLQGKAVNGALSMPAQSIAFVAVKGASNKACS